MNTHHADSSFLQVLDEMEGVIERQIERTHMMKSRIAHLREAMSHQSLVEVIRNEPSPLLVQLISENMDALSTYGAAVRRTEAQALYAHGMTMDEIASLFGVTRQRISALVSGSLLTRPAAA